MDEDRGKLIRQTQSGRKIYPVKETGPTGKKITLSIIIIIVIIVVAIIGVGYFVIKNLGSGNSADNVNALNSNINSSNNTNNENSLNDNTNAAPSISVNQEITVQGRVFIKGYDTPSESYGILTTDGNEVGMGKYDSMKEQLRPYVNDDINVTFKSICRTTSSDCCLTLFYYCGTVDTWEPLEE